MKSILAFIAMLATSPLLTADPAQSGVQQLSTNRALQNPSAPKKIAVPPAPTNPIPISSLPVTISNPGYYQATHDLTGVVGSIGIEVLVENVIIDLNGFMMTKGTTGIQCGARTTIFNGLIFGFDGDGISSSDKCTVVGVSSNANQGDGMDLGPGSIVQDCTVLANVGDGIRGSDLTVVLCNAIENGMTGIQGLDDGLFVSGCKVTMNGERGISHFLPDPAEPAGSPCVIEDSRITDNKFGVSLPSFAQVRRCLMSGNTVVGLLVGESSYVGECIVFGSQAGIVANLGSTIERCTTRSNTTGITVTGASSVIDCVSNDNEELGIEAFGTVSVRGCNLNGNGEGVEFRDRGGRIEGCTVFGNQGFGISVVTEVLVLNNEVAENLSNGVIASGDSNRIEGNHVANNSTGIQVAGKRNLIVRNTLDSNVTIQMQIASGNFQGPFLKGNGLIDNTNPWANLDLSFPTTFP